jgi:inositol phosphorylceramide mannosyltransferase catalytic subunit
MALQSLLLRPHSKIVLLIVLLLLTLTYFSSVLHTTLVTLALPVTWLSTSDFFISQERDQFDVTFAKYSVDQQTSLPEHPDLIPPILHQISLGSGLKAEWLDARNSCLQHHVDWETHFWTDENAHTFVAEKFPHLKDMWENYRYPIQKVDALRYMVLYEYGGMCMPRAPQLIVLLILRRGGAGYGSRLSALDGAPPKVRFRSACCPPGRLLERDDDGEQATSFRRRAGAQPRAIQPQLVRASLPHGDVQHRLPLCLVSPTLPRVQSAGPNPDRSVIHTFQKNRTDLRILTGPKEFPFLHRLNGDVVTPLFHHLGASSWHSFDAALIVSLGRIDGRVWSRGISLVVFVCVLGIAVWAGMLRVRLNRRRASSCGRSRSPEGSVFDDTEESFKRA